MQKNGYLTTFFLGVYTKYKHWPYPSLIMYAHEN